MHTPSLVNLRVDRVTSAQCVAALKPLWNTKRETGMKIRQRLSAAFKLAVAEGHRKDNPINAASAALPSRRGDAQRRRNQAALSYAEVADALATVERSAAWVGQKLAFRFLVLTARWPAGQHMCKMSSMSLPEEIKTAFKHFARGEFEAGLTKLRDSPSWEGNNDSLDGPFFLGFPGARGWGEGLFLASLLRRDAAATGRAVQVFAQGPVCSILRNDPHFSVTTVGDYNEAKQRGGRPPLAILAAALRTGGDLLKLPFGSVTTDVPARNNRRSNRIQIGVAWASVDTKQTPTGEKVTPIKCKSIPTRDFRQILRNVSDADVVSFQRKLHEAGLDKDLPSDWTRVPSDCLDKHDQSEVVRRVLNLDCMVTISTTTAHIAACLGVHTILIAAQRPHQQWFWAAQKRGDRCFYPSVEIVSCEQDRAAPWWVPCIEPARERFESAVGIRSES